MKTSRPVANLLILGVYGYYFRLSSVDSDLFYRSVQEDETLEWGTFWAFVLATAVFAAAARKVPVGRGWFLWLLSLFCFAVALEEISWGQRILGFRPPAYFLANNYQQELNIHNVMSQDARTLGLQSALLGYGVLVPFLALWPPVRRFMERLGIVPAPAFLIPSFLATSYLHWTYPLKFTGEIVEMMLGLGLLFSGLLELHRTASPGSPLRRLPAALPLLAGFILAMGL
ncbi:MAG: hypothetical protein ACE5ID_12770, partial [Acidobacteriota bacterium]